MSQEVYFLVMRLQTWEGLKLEQVGKFKLPFPCEMVKPEGEIGFLHVFDDFIKAQEFAAGEADVVGVTLK